MQRRSQSQSRCGPGSSSESHVHPAQHHNPVLSHPYPAARANACITLHACTSGRLTHHIARWGAAAEEPLRTCSGCAGSTLTRTLLSLSVLTMYRPSGDTASAVMMLQKWPSSSCGKAVPFP